MKKYFRRFKDEKAWEEVDEKTVLEYTEKSGYWKKGTVLKMLDEGTTIFTPFAEYKKE
jgi:hypothetical protein